MNNIKYITIIYIINLISICYAESPEEFFKNSKNIEIATPKSEYKPVKWWSGTSELDFGILPSISIELLKNNNFIKIDNYIYVNSRIKVSELRKIFKCNLSDFVFHVNSQHGNEQWFTLNDGTYIDIEYIEGWSNKIFDNYNLIDECYIKATVNIDIETTRNGRKKLYEERMNYYKNKK